MSRGRGSVVCASERDGKVASAGGGGARRQGASKTQRRRNSRRLRASERDAAADRVKTMGVRRNGGTEPEEEWLGNRTLCDFYRELANFAIELYRRQWQSARALDGLLRAGFSSILSRSPPHARPPRAAGILSRFKFRRDENANGKSGAADRHPRPSPFEFNLCAEALFPASLCGAVNRGSEFALLNPAGMFLLPAGVIELIPIDYTITLECNVVIVRLLPEYCNTAIV